MAQAILDGIQSVRVTVVANPADVPCVDDAETPARVALNAGALSVDAKVLSATVVLDTLLADVVIGEAHADVHGTDVHPERHPLHQLTRPAHRKRSGHGRDGGPTSCKLARRKMKIVAL